ncbi:unnamed protein product [Lampetra fluviatilis]
MFPSLRSQRYLNPVPSHPQVQACPGKAQGVATHSATLSTIVKRAFMMGTISVGGSSSSSGIGSKLAPRN